MEYEEGALNARVNLMWRLRRDDPEVVPQERLFTAERLEEGDGLRGVYRSPQRYLAYTQRGGNLYAIFFEKIDIMIPGPNGAELILGELFQ